MENTENNITTEKIENTETLSKNDMPTGNYIEFDVTMDKNILYDFMINHAYHGSSGIVGTCFGAIGIILFVASNYQNYIYLILGIVLIFYLPVSLKFQCAKQMTLNPVYKNSIHYLLDANGITVSQGDMTQTVGWDKCTKAISTKQSIAVYTGKNNASIFPRAQMADQLPSMLAILSEYMEPKNVRVRY